VVQHPLAAIGGLQPRKQSLNHRAQSQAEVCYLQVEELSLVEVRSKFLK
jgi:hypothetical protein